MNTEAQKLIRLLEQECKKLRRLIARDVREEDYKLADAHDRALQRALVKLRLVQNLEDVNADRKEFLKMLVGRYASARESKGSYKAMRLQEYEDELASLERQGPIPVPESNLLAVQLQLVVEGTVKGINIVLSASKRLSVQIRHQKQCILLFIPHQAHLREKGVIGNRQIERLVTMGLAEVSGQRLEMKFKKNEETHTRMMTVLSRIVFDILWYSDFADQSHIEVIDA